MLSPAEDRRQKVSALGLRGRRSRAFPHEASPAGHARGERPPVHDIFPYRARGSALVPYRVLVRVRGQIRIRCSSCFLRFVAWLRGWAAKTIRTTPISISRRRCSPFGLSLTKRKLLAASSTGEIRSPSMGSKTFMSLGEALDVPAPGGREPLEITRLTLGNLSSGSPAIVRNANWFCKVHD